MGSKLLYFLGVTILMTANFSFRVNQIDRDNNGNLIALNLDIGHYTKTLITLHGLNVDTLHYFTIG